MNSDLPVLYSFRRCPYAIRARMALAYASITVELREISLQDKPPEMLAASNKGTVPVLLLNDGRVLDQSVDIMNWAMQCRDDEGYLQKVDDDLLLQNDGDFKHYLDRYKYADRYPEQTVEAYKAKAEIFIQRLDDKLSKSRYLLGDTVGFTDVAIFPFVRQFAGVDQAAFDASPYVRVRDWLSAWLESGLFLRVMVKYPLWQVEIAPIYVDWSDHG